MAPTWAKAVQTLDSLHEGFTRALFAQLLLERGLNRELRDSWATTAAATAFDELDCLFRSADSGSREAVLELDGTLVLLSWWRTDLRVRIAAAGAKEEAAALARLRQRFPVSEPRENEVPISFWSLSSEGHALRRSRRIVVPGWDEITGNYATATRDEVEQLMQGFQPARGGQLLLWHGPPGTGKTYALRALAWAWRDWCSIHYVTDPERFFGSPADYMLEVVMDDEDDGWRLLVLEDTGELLLPDAKETSGQGLSRLLNLVDGIIGQGLRVLVLVTTNEQVKHLHPAVARPGRCAAEVEFGPLSRAELGEWLAEHVPAGLAVEDPGDKSLTLSEAYALLGETGSSGRRRRQLGFAAATG